MKILDFARCFATTSSIIKMLRNSFKQNTVAGIGNLREVLVVTKHDGSQNGHWEPGARLGAHILVRQELEIFPRAANRQYQSDNQG